MLNLADEAFKMDIKNKFKELKETIFFKLKKKTMTMTQ